MISSIEGQRPEVRTRPPFPAQQGLFNKPTIVNNVETLATVPYVIEHGGAAYAKLGAEKSNGPSTPGQMGSSFSCSIRWPRVPTQRLA